MCKNLYFCACVPVGVAVFLLLWFFPGVCETGGMAALIPPAAADGTPAVKSPSISSPSEAWTLLPHQIIPSLMVVPHKNSLVDSLDFQC